MDYPPDNDSRNEEKNRRQTIGLARIAWLVIVLGVIMAMAGLVLGWMG